MNSFVRNKAIVAFVLFTLFCIISLSVHDSSFTFTFEGIGSAVVMPFQKAYDGIQSGISKIWAGFSELSEVKRELEKTREKLQQYEAASEEFSEIRKENERLRELLDMQALISYKSLAASVISKDPDNWFRTIIIDRGSSDGVKANMPVVAFRQGQKAVVGKIVEVRGSISRIQPLIASDMKLGVQLQESRYPGLLYGRAGNSSMCIVDYIAKPASVKFGDMICTSGQGGVFPEGLLVGTVMSVDIPESTAYQRLYIKPIIDFPVLEEVFIIMKEPDLEIQKLIGSQE